jgi:hypothetical protein
MNPESRPTIIVGYQGRFFGGAIAIRPGERLAARAAAPVPFPAPVPRPSDGYRYDGGPSSAVPMPSPDSVPATDPVPATVPALNRVMWKGPRPSVSYPAYGAKSVAVDPRFVKN